MQAKGRTIAGWKPLPVSLGPVPLRPCAGTPEGDAAPPTRLIAALLTKAW